MYALILTICTLSTNVFGFTTSECVTTSPASYANYSFCKNAGKSYSNSITSSNVKVTFTCEKY